MAIIIGGASPKVSKVEKASILLLTPRYIKDNLSQMRCGAMEFLNLKMEIYTMESLLIVLDVEGENTYQSSPINKAYYFSKESTETTLKMVQEESNIKITKLKELGKTVFMSLSSLIN